MLTFAYRLLSSLAQSVPLPKAKLATSMAGRRTAGRRWVAWAALHRTSGPLVWVHGASVGEGLTALPVIARLRNKVSGIQIVHSFTSPSAVSWSNRMQAEKSDYIPIDESRTWESVLDAIRPNLLVCSRGDLWPETARAFSEREIPVAVISGCVRPTSGRLKAPLRHAMAKTYERISWLGATTEENASRWISLGVRGSSVIVTGDTRHDQILERILAVDKVRPILGWCRDEPTLLAGSTDQNDEQVVMSAFAKLATSEGGTRVVLVPHDVSEHRIREVCETADSCGIRSEVWGGGEPRADAECIIVKEMGLLADAYFCCDIAYVGGGFSRAGLHAVIEPAALGIPVIFGPRFGNSDDAGLLLDCGGGRAISALSPVESLTRFWSDWLNRPRERTEAGMNARGALQQGAAARTTASLIELL